MIFINLFLGILSLILIPGYCLINFLPKYFNTIEKIGLIFIMGITYQLFIIYLMFIASINISEFDFQFIISLFSILPLIILNLVQNKVVIIYSLDIFRRINKNFKLP